MNCGAQERLALDRRNEPETRTWNLVDGDLQGLMNSQYRCYCFHPRAALSIQARISRKSLQKVTVHAACTIRAQHVARKRLSLLLNSNKNKLRWQNYRVSRSRNRCQYGFCFSPPLSGRVRLKQVRNQQNFYIRNSKSLLRNLVLNSRYSDP